MTENLIGIQRIYGRLTGSQKQQMAPINAKSDMQRHGRKYGNLKNNIWSIMDKKVLAQKHYENINTEPEHFLPAKDRIWRKCGRIFFCGLGT